MRKVMLIREQNVARKRKSRAQMSSSKIEEIREYDRQRKRIMRSRRKEMAQSGHPIVKESISSTKPLNGDGKEVTDIIDEFVMEKNEVSHQL
ncbi:MAG: hypothetical protein MJE68_19820 [Proteobacteria bacterium]|nr:hypothetical protein [Pseudomonadota bacterium]